MPYRRRSRLPSSSEMPDREVHVGRRFPLFDAAGGCSALLALARSRCLDYKNSIPQLIENVNIFLGVTKGETELFILFHEKSWRKALRFADPDKLARSHNVDLKGN